MTEQNQISTDAGWRLFMRRHWVVFAAFISAAILVAAGTIYVFVWFTGNIQAVGLVPSSLSLWSMMDIVIFILHAIFWELLLIGIPAAIGGVIGWQWWKHIPEQEKQQYNLESKRSKGRDAGRVISPLLFIIFAIKVYLDGNWTQAIASWNVDYVVGSMVTIVIWIAAICAIPAAIALAVWIGRTKTSQPSTPTFTLKTLNRNFHT